MDKEGDTGRKGGHVRRQRYLRDRGGDAAERRDAHERAPFTRNYRERHLCPREHRGYRDERNYMRGFYEPRRNYAPPRRLYAAERPQREPLPSKDEMDRALAQYMERR